MQFIDSRQDFPISKAVIHNGKVLETVLTAIPKGQTKPVEGGAGAEMREIFSQLDVILAEAGLDKTNLCTARLYLENVLGDVAEVNEAWTEYLGGHPVCRRCYGVDLQSGMLVEAAFVAEFPK